MLMTMLIDIWLTTAIRRGFALYECLLVIIIIIIIIIIILLLLFLNPRKNEGRKKIQK